MRTFTWEGELSDEQNKLLAAIDHETLVLSAIGAPFGDVEHMDRRRVAQTMEIATDVSRIRIAALWCRLQETAS